MWRATAFEEAGKMRSSIPGDEYYNGGARPDASEGHRQTTDATTPASETRAKYQYAADTTDLQVNSRPLLHNSSRAGSTDGLNHSVSGRMACVGGFADSKA